MDDKSNFHWPNRAHTHTHTHDGVGRARVYFDGKPKRFHYSKNSKFLLFMTSCHMHVAFPLYWCCCHSTYLWSLSISERKMHLAARPLHAYWLNQCRSARLLTMMNTPFFHLIALFGENVHRKLCAQNANKTIFLIAFPIVFIYHRIVAKSSLSTCGKTPPHFARSPALCAACTVEAVTANGAPVNL